MGFVQDMPTCGRERSSQTAAENQPPNTVHNGNHERKIYTYITGMGIYCGFFHMFTAGGALCIGIQLVVWSVGKIWHSRGRAGSKVNFQTLD